MSRFRMPRGFTAWVTASIGAELGAGVLGFALTWVASGLGPTIASTVLTLTVAPSVVLGLLGGIVADRFGPRRVMIAGTLALLTISAATAVAVTLWGTPAPLLLLVAVLIGTVSAFLRPALGVFPRLFVDDDALGAAMARAGMASQLARTVAPPLGGLLIGLIALSGVALLDVAGCAVMLLTLLLIRPPLERAPARDTATLRGIVEGVTAARRTGGVPALLGAVAIVAGAVIPAVVLGIPLAARERGWTAAEAGIIEAGWIAGGLVAGAWYAWRGTASAAWRPMTAGPIVVAAGLGILALAPTWTTAIAGTVVVGVGVVVFTAHLFPTYVLLAPTAMISRFQSLLILAQQAPQLLATLLIGLAVAAFGTGPMIAASAALAVAASLVVSADPSLRSRTTIAR